MIAHEYANLFPMMGESELARLADDIRENGLSDPIISYEGKILDGRNRYRACEIAGIDPVVTEYDGTDALAFVISHNLHRRHLTESQRAMVASKVATMRRGNPEFGNAIPPIGEIAKLSHKDRAQAAAELNVGTSSLDRARRVQRDGIPALNDMVEQGEVSVHAALEVSKLPESEQRKAVSGGVAGVKEAAKKQSASFSPSVDSSAPESSKETPKSDRIPNWIPDDAQRLWTLARQDLNKILKTDKSRVRILNEIIAYAQKRLDENR